jgi:hypothetical protein
MGFDKVMQAAGGIGYGNEQAIKKTPKQETKLLSRWRKL